MRKFWRTSLRPFGQNNVGISNKLDTWGRLHYTRREIKNDQPGSHDFQRFLCQFLTGFLEILQRLFSIKILTGVKICKIIFNISKVRELRPFVM